MNVRMKIATIGFAATMALATIGSALASPQPPTNGGNGAGQSGQCTGPAADRPASCQSSK